MSAPEIGDIRYYAEYIDHAQGVEIMKASGGNPEHDSILDYCNQEDITVRSVYFPSKWKAVRWAKQNKAKDAFNMPRIVEQTYQERPADSIHNAGSDRYLADPRKNIVVDTDRAFTPPLTNDELLRIYDYGKDF